MSETPITSALAAPAGDIERLLTFAHGNAIYALPIAEVHEVAEVDRICCVPTIPADQVGVVNWHGDALPVVSAGLLLGSVGEEPSIDAMPAESGEPDDPSGETSDAPEEGRRALHAGHILVVSARDDEPARLGLPIDRVLGLVDGPRRRRGGNELIVERRPLDGRVVNVLDPHRLVARATEVIGRQMP